MKEKFDIKGMSCTACSSKIQNKMDNTDGVIKAEVNLLTNSMTVEFDEKKINTSDIISEVRNLGYGASIKGVKMPEETIVKESDDVEIARKFF